MELATASFKELYLGFGEFAGMPVPALLPDDRGVTAFSLHVDGVPVTVMHSSIDAPANAFVLVEFGAVPAARALEAWYLLLEANLLAFGEHTPVFGRDPASGGAVLRLACPLASTSPAELHRQLLTLAGVARRWRADGFLDLEGQPGAADEQFLHLRA